MLHKSISSAIVILACCSFTSALEPGTDVWVPAAARTTTWVTDLFILNPGDGTASVDVYWLPRDHDNGGSTPIHFELGPEKTLVLADVIEGTFGLTSGLGAFRVVASLPVTVNCRIFDTAGGAGTRGQGFEGIPFELAVNAGSVTHIAGLAQNQLFRSNLFAVNTRSTSTRLRFLQLATNGTVTATSRTYELLPFAALYLPVTEIGGPPFDEGSVRVEVDAGSAVVAGSKVDQISQDPTTLEAWWRSSAPSEDTFSGTYHGSVRDLTGFLGGVVLEVDDDEAVRQVDFTFPSISCGFTLAGGEIFDPPRALVDFTDGVSFTDTYLTGGTMTWTLRLDSPADPVLLEGVIEAAGVGFTGAQASCNGQHQGDTVRLGREIP